MQTTRPAPGAPTPPADTTFQRVMDELDAVQALRLRDPEAALQALRTLAVPWARLPAGTQALVRARIGLQTGTALLMLGRQDDADAALQALHRQLQSPLLNDAAVAPELWQAARRCEVSCANAQAALAHGRGDYGGALRAYQRSLDLARALGERSFEAHVLVNLANTFEESGLPAQALEVSMQALDLAQALGMDELVADIHHNIGNALAASGQGAQGLASNRHALRAYEALGLQQKMGYALVAIAERLLELGRTDEAEQALRERASHAGAFANPQYEAYAAFLRGRIARARGEAEAARRAFAQALQISGDRLDDAVNQARTRLELARLALSESRPDEAQRQAQDALAGLQPSQAHRDLMQAHLLLSQTARLQGRLQEALDHHESFHACYERCFNEEAARKTAVLAVRHEVELARADAHRQRVENARLAEALAAIGARMAPPRAADHAVLPLPRPSRPAHPEDLQALGLTPREAEVLYWVTQGKTNDDVTQILGIGLSAVKKHLSSIFDKLGVENRTAAANAVLCRQPAD